MDRTRMDIQLASLNGQAVITPSRIRHMRANLRGRAGTMISMHVYRERRWRKKGYLSLRSSTATLRCTLAVVYSAAKGSVVQTGSRLDDDFVLPTVGSVTNR